MSILINFNFFFDSFKSREFVSILFVASYLKPCKVTGEDIGKCVENVMNTIRPQLSEGIKELGIPPMKKLEIKQLNFDLNGGNSNLTITFDDLIFNGAENFVVKSAKVNPTNAIFELIMLVPHFRSTSKYHLKGRLILLDLDANGDVELNFSKYLNITLITTK